MGNPFFLTLTFKGERLGNQDSLDHINQCWRRMAKVLRDKAQMQGYIKVIDAVKRRQGRFYFHLHTAVDLVNPISDNDMHCEWYNITKDSYITKAIVINTTFNDYFTKYLIKGYDILSGSKTKLISFWSKEKVIVIKKGKPKCPYCGSALVFDEKTEYSQSELCKTKQFMITEFVYTH